MLDKNKVDAFNEKYKNNYHVEGFGIGNVHVHYPCPFCAEPEFMVVEIMETETKLTEEHVCKSCQRGCKALFQRTELETQFEMVQTCGPDQEVGLVKMRRL